MDDLHTTANGEDVRLFALVRRDTSSSSDEVDGNVRGGNLINTNCSSGKTVSATVYHSGVLDGRAATRSSQQPLGHREREISSVEDSGGSRSRSGLRLAKKERRQKLKEGEGTEAFTGNIFGVSCEDAGLQEIIIGISPQQASSLSEWAAPLLDTKIDTATTTNIETTAELTIKQDSLRRGKRDLMRSWLGTPSSGMQNGGLVASPYSSNDDSGAPLIRNCAQHQSSSLGSGSLTTTTISNNNSGVGGVFHSIINNPHVNRATTVTTTTSASDGDDDYTYSLTDTGAMLSMEGHRDITSLDDLDSPFSTTSDTITSSTALPQPPVIQLNPQAFQPTHSSIISTYLQASKPKVGGGSLEDDEGDNERVLHRTDTSRNQSQPFLNPTRFISNSQIIVDNPTFGVSSRGNDDADDDFNKGIGCEVEIDPDTSAIIILLHPGPKSRNVVTFNADAYNLDAWDADVMGLFALPTDGSPVAVNAKHVDVVSKPNNFVGATIVPSKPTLSTFPAIYTTSSSSPAATASSSTPAVTVSSTRRESSSSIVDGPWGVSRSGPDPLLWGSAVDDKECSATQTSSYNVLASYFDQSRSPKSGNHNSRQPLLSSSTLVDESPSTNSVDSSKRGTKPPPHKLVALGASCHQHQTALSSSSEGNNNTSSSLHHHQIHHRDSSHQHQLQRERNNADLIHLHVIIQLVAKDHHIASTAKSILLHPHENVDENNYNDSTAENVQVFLPSRIKTEENNDASTRTASISLVNGSHLISDSGNSSSHHKLSSFRANFSHSRTSFSGVVSQFVTVDTLVHKATSYTEQLANPTSGAGHQKFRQEHDRWLSLSEQHESS